MFLAVKRYSLGSKVVLVCAVIMITFCEKLQTVYQYMGINSVLDRSFKCSFGRLANDTTQ